MIFHKNWFINIKFIHILAACTRLSVAFEMLANRNCLLDEVVKIFRNHWCKSLGFQDAQNFVASDKAHLSNAMRVSQYHTCTRKLKFEHQTISDKLIINFN